MERTQFSPEAVSRHPAARSPCFGGLLADRSAGRSANPSMRRAGARVGRDADAARHTVCKPDGHGASAREAGVGQSAVPALPGPSLTRVPGYDPGFLNDAVVRIEAKVPGDAESSASLGARRSGTGVPIDPRTVLTIGYLLLEADEVDLLTPSGKRIPAVSPATTTHPVSA